MIYLDNAATSFPKPETVYQATDRFFRTRAANPGRGTHRLALLAGESVRETRETLARFFNIPDAHRLVFTASVTMALNLALKGLLQPGDHVLVSSLEHNAVIRPLNSLASQGVEYDFVPGGPYGILSPADLERALNKNTRLVAVNHGSNVCGTVQPLKELGDYCHKKGLLLLADVAQTAGILPVDVQDMKIDLLAFTGHKGLFGPPGTGGLYISDGIELKPLVEGGTGTSSELPRQPAELPGGLESGTLNTVGLAGLKAGVEFILGEGLAKIRAHDLALMEQLLRGLAKIPEVKLYAPPEPQSMAPVLSFNLAGWSPQEVAYLLDARDQIAVRAGLHCAPLAHRTLGTFPAGSVRVSPGYFNRPEEVETFIQAISEL